MSDTVASGWNVYRVRNRSEEEIHEVTVVRLPEGPTLDQYLDEFTAPWQEALDELHAGLFESADAAVEEAYLRLPGWTEELEYIRSRGLTSPGRTTEFALRLEPGRYVFECWLKAPDGRLHTLHGMHQVVEVVEDEAGAWRPQPDHGVILSSDGIRSDGDLAIGRSSVQVTFAEGAPYSDLHLVRVDEETDLPEVVRWMDWYASDGLQAPAPATFLGGLHDYRARAGAIGYFVVHDVEPGLYAWVSAPPAGEASWEIFEVR